MGVERGEVNRWTYLEDALRQGSHVVEVYGSGVVVLTLASNHDG